MAAKRKSIQLKGSRDSDIAQWCVLVKEYWDGGISYLTKKAIRNYMNHGTFICIGKIHKCKDEASVLSQQASISLWLGDSPDIEQWMELISSRSIRPSTLIREIMRKSISIVPEDEPEWIPTCLDFGTDVFDIINSSQNKTIENHPELTHNPSPAPVMSSVREPEKRPADTNIHTPAQDIKEVKEIQTFNTAPRGSQKKLPRAAALSGRRFSQH